MTSIRDLVGETLDIGAEYCLELEQADQGRLLARHPNPRSPMDIEVCRDLERLENVPPKEPVTVRICGEMCGDRLVGKVIEPACDDPANTGRPSTDS